MYVGEKLVGTLVYEESKVIYSLANLDSTASEITIKVSSTKPSYIQLAEVQVFGTVAKSKKFLITTTYHYSTKL